MAITVKAGETVKIEHCIEVGDWLTGEGAVAAKSYFILKITRLSDRSNYRYKFFSK
jgi:hypothetical protein